MLFRMFSTLVADRLVQFSQVFRKQLVAGMPAQSSKKPAGKLVRLEQPNQALPKFVPDDVSSSGKLVRLEQLRQAELRIVTHDV